MMLLDIKDNELFDEKTNKITFVKGQKILLEHSLLSISKWETKWKKPFLNTKEKTLEETIYYVKCMTLNDVEDENIYKIITSENLMEIQRYMEDPMTATTISNINKSHNREILTNEVIYYMMFANQIPKECETWHLNRLLMLISVFGAKNQSPKKMSAKELANRNHNLNAARKAARKR